MKKCHEVLSAALPDEGHPTLIGRELTKEELITRAAEKIVERAETLARAVAASEAIIAMAVDVAVASLSEGSRTHESELETLQVAKQAATKTLQIAKEDAEEVLALAREVAKELLALAESKATSSAAK